MTFSKLALLVHAHTYLYLSVQCFSVNLCNLLVHAHTYLYLSVNASQSTFVICWCMPTHTSTFQFTVAVSTLLFVHIYPHTGLAALSIIALCAVSVSNTCMNAHQLCTCNVTHPHAKCHACGLPHTCMQTLMYANTHVWVCTDV